jgi:serine/threonine protein kinase
VASDACANRTRILGATYGSKCIGCRFSGTHSTTGEVVAIKFTYVPPKAKIIPSSKRSLRDLEKSQRKEAEIYGRLESVEGVCRILWSGNVAEFSVIVMELLGYDTNHLARFCGGRFSLCTTLKLADQLLVRLETLHKAGIIHNDLKPLNISMGLGPTKDLVYVIDYGLATKLEEDEETGGFVQDMTQVLPNMSHCQSTEAPPCSVPKQLCPSVSPAKLPAAVS